jgi:mannose-6-phosphate isomerase-like protein (cupin superfamily)
MLVLSGNGVVDLAGESADIGPRELVVLPANHEHVVHNPGVSA